MLILNLVRLGEQASTLIAEALQMVEMSQPQALICWRLHENKSTGLTLTELSQQLAVPLTRLQNQIPVLINGRVIKLMIHPSAPDRRKKFYQLTALGVRKTKLFITAVQEIDAQLENSLLPQRIKDQERWRSIRDQFIDAHLQLPPSR